MGAFAFLSKIKKLLGSSRLCCSQIVSSLEAFTEVRLKTLGDEAAFQNSRVKTYPSESTDGLTLVVSFFQKS